MEDKNVRNKTVNLGQRKVSPMNFSNVVTLPKAFTNNYLGKNRIVAMRMTYDGELILTPVNSESGGKQA